VTFTRPNPNAATDFTIRALGRFNGVNIRAQCSAVLASEKAGTVSIVPDASFWLKGLAGGSVRPHMKPNGE
jgi:hypothetical protein